MSVYTHLTAPELRRFLTNYALTDLVDFGGIAAGIENTNYRIQTATGRYVLTLFEQTAAEELPFCIDLMAALAGHGIPSAMPIADRRGCYLQVLKGKPALLVQHLPGASVEQPTAQQIRALGETLARMHTLTRKYPHRRANERGHQWHLKTAAAVRDRLSGDDRALLDRELAAAAAFDMTELPQGVIHADLFRDNALFEDDHLSGLIDFYYAHTGALIYDLAVVVGDWCFDPSGGGFALDRARPLLAAYAATRAPVASERAGWTACLRAVGLRFWLSRLFDKSFPRGGVLTQTKDPEVFRTMLLLLEADPGTTAQMWE